MKTGDPHKINKMFREMQGTSKTILKNVMRISLQSGNLDSYHTILYKFSPFELSLLDEINVDINREANLR